MSLASTPRIAVALSTSLLIAALTLIIPVSSHAAESPVLVSSDAETQPVLNSGDAMDDPAIWVHPSEPERSLVIGNDKAGALETYDLSGSVVQRLGVGDSWGNVDVRQDLTIGGYTGDLVVAVSNGVRFFSVDPATRLLTQVNEDTPVRALGEGLCVYQSPTTRKVYGFSITIQGALTQYEILDSNGDGLLESNTVRTFALASEAEGCVADDDTGALYISEEDEALWRYSAEPDGGAIREAVDVLTAAGGHLANDIEGVTLVDQSDGGGFVIASAQNVADPDASYFSVYDRGPGNDFVNTFRISNGVSSDDCDRTDGITASTANLGPAYPRGMFVCQDNNNDLPGTSGNQNLKMARLENVVNLDGGGPPPPPPPPDPSPIAFVDQATSNTHSTAFSVRIPAATQPGDGLLLIASYATFGTLTGPGQGWTELRRVVDNGHATTVWRRVAAPGDAGALVRLTNGGTYTKMGLTVAAYRGTDPTDPVQVINGAGEPALTAAHTTPLVPNDTTGAWRVSYWSDKTSATTRWSAPAGETVRATTAGAGSGRITTLLTDPASPVTRGAPADTGGLTAVADASSGAASMWTILLRPADETLPANVPPTARFTWSCAELVCSFDGTTSSDPEDSIAAYAWDFGGGDSSSDATPEHTFAGPGSYDVELTVTDDVGATDRVQHTVLVAEGPITFVDQATSNTHNLTFAAGVPTTVQSGTCCCCSSRRAPPRS